MIVARMLRVLLVACGVAVVLVVGVGGGSFALGSGQLAVLLPFVAAAAAAIGLGVVLPRIDRVVERLTHHREVTPYSALAAAAARTRAGSLEQALPGLAQVLADGTGATRAAVWLAVGEHLVVGAQYPTTQYPTTPYPTTQFPPRDPAEPEQPPEAVANLAVLLTRPDTDHVVPVLDGTALRAALTIGKPGGSITPADQRLVQDVANGAALLLRSVALNAELAERVRRADHLADELQGSRQRLAKAREVERRRLVTELAHATTDRLARLRADVSAARGHLNAHPEDVRSAKQALYRARVGLDDLLDRFRVIARGVYPAVLRHQGPVAALDEVAADLPRTVRVTGSLEGRLDWEIESGIYYVAAAAMSELAGGPAEDELVVHLERADGRVIVRIDDLARAGAAEQLRAGLAEDVERLAALGGDIQLTGSDGSIGLRAWLPDRLEPVVVDAELRRE